MSDRRYAPGLSPADPGQTTYAAPASIDIRWFIGIAVAVPLFVAGGVYWLHHVPAGPQREAGGMLVEVSLVRSAEPAAELATASIQPEIKDQSEVLPTPEPPIPEEADEAEAEPMLTPTASSPPSSQDQPPGTFSYRSQASNSTRLTFQQALKQHILRYLPPKELYGRKITIVQFHMRRDGMLSQVWVQQSSGDSVFDQAALDTIRRAQPLPRIPPDMPDQMWMGIPIASKGQ